MRKLSCIILTLFVLILSASAQQWAKEVLEKSPRQQELVAIKDGEHTINAFIVYPQTQQKATVVIVIHENSGLTDWTRTVADQLAANGYIAVAPDLLSHLAPPANPGADSVPQFKSEVLSDLDAVFAYARQLPAANGKVAVAGFDWGAGQAFRYATHNPSLAAAFIFYGPPPAPSEASLANIKAPVYAFYAANDEPINATLSKTATEMNTAGKTFAPVTYAASGHGFMRTGMAPNAADGDRRARDDSWQRWIQLLKEIQ